MSDSGQFLESEHFREKAFLVITGMTELNYEVKEKTQEDASELVDEILHSIFFLGEISISRFSPESILEDFDNDEHKNLLKRLKSRYPRPFQLYSTQLPRRSPFSCVLDMMVKLVGQENEEEIRRRLKQFITDVEGGVSAEHLISTAICVSQNSNNSVRHYGVSMSTSGKNPGRIMIAASCLSAWDDYVAGAVMTYCPNTSINTYFNGTIQIPQDVRCQTFSLRNGGEMNPCRSCSNMFGLRKDANEKNEWPYGNCAEAESLSNLLENEREVKEQSQPTSDKWTPENIEKAREEVLKELKKVLNMVKFKWDDNFYTPQKSTA